MEKMIITTTNSIENSTIQRYFELVSTNVVIGTNLFSDIGASFTDLLGGYSGTYQNQLYQIEKMALSNLKEQAYVLGANAIVGLKIDFDEISGKGKSMFMVSAMGMAVYTIPSDPNFHKLESDLTKISSNQLNKELTKRVIIKKLSNSELPTQEQWTYLLNNPINEIAQDLLDIYLKLKDDPFIIGTQLLRVNFVEYIKLIDYDVAVNILYSNIILSFEKIWNLLNSGTLFSAKKVLDLIEEKRIKVAIECLKISKRFYTKDDLILMKRIIEKLDSLPNTGSIETANGLLTKGKEKFVCQSGHKNNVETKFCASCGIDIKGMTWSDYELIDSFRLKVESLEFLANNNI